MMLYIKQCATKQNKRWKEASKSGISMECWSAVWPSLKIASDQIATVDSIHAYNLRSIDYRKYVNMTIKLIGRKNIEKKSFRKTCYACTSIFNLRICRVKRMKIYYSCAIICALFLAQTYLLSVQSPSRLKKSLDPSWSVPVL